MRRWPMAFYSGLQARRLKRFERWICRTVDGVLSVSAADQRLLDRYGGASTFVVPNGVFVDDYLPAAAPHREPKSAGFHWQNGLSPKCGCDGMVQRQGAAASAAAAVSRQLSLSLWGAVRIDASRPWPRRRTFRSLAMSIRRCRICIGRPWSTVPLRMGSGTRLKILEAMAAGCAVVSSSVGAAGLHDDIWQAIEIADGEVDFAQAVLSLLEDERSAAGLGAAGQATSPRAL